MLCALSTRIIKYKEKKRNLGKISEITKQKQLKTQGEKGNLPLYIYEWGTKEKGLVRVGHNGANGPDTALFQ